MDVVALRGGNALLGNEHDAAAIEWALTGGELGFDKPAAFVLTGAEADARLNDRSVEPNRVHQAGAGDSLLVQRLIRGHFLYVCVAGGINVPLRLGARGTYLPGAFGGFHGRLLRHGDELPVADPKSQPLPDRELPLGLRTVGDDSPLALLRGPQADELDDEGWSTLTNSELTVSHASDRMGYRLDGMKVPAASDTMRPSEPTCPGAVQLTPGGQLIVLMADGPTVGGYPKIAVIATADLARFAQRMPGEHVRFRFVSVAEARTKLAAREAALGNLAR
jgi:biotin-dependent carboxylase-like uncharacterized protein